MKWTATNRFPNLWDTVICVCFNQNVNVWLKQENVLNMFITQELTGAIGWVQVSSVCLPMLKIWTEICLLSTIKEGQLKCSTYKSPLVIKYHWRQTIVFKLLSFEVMMPWLGTIGALDCVLQLYQELPSVLPSSTALKWTLWNCFFLAVAHYKCLALMGKIAVRHN